MKKKMLRSLSAFALATTVSAGMFALAACKFDEDPPLTDAPLSGEMLMDWSQGESDLAYKSQGWSNKGSFNTEWSADYVNYEDGVMKLTLGENPDGTKEDCNEYLGGELRTYSWYGYGDYEVCMKPSDKPGTASTFFICTGSYDKNPDTGENNPWDEIDIEFLGKDTTKVQFNFYQDGDNNVRGHEYMYDLGFDASEEFHTYGFRWAEDYIVWFVDGEPVYRVDDIESDPQPTTPGRILMNYWCGTEQAVDWMGKYEGVDDTAAEYKWVKTSAEAIWTEQPGGSEDTPGDTPGETPEIPTEGTKYPVDMSKVTVGGDLASVNGGPYTATVENNALNVTYASVSDYKNVSLSGLSAMAKANNVFMAKVKNNGTETVNLRVDIMSSENVSTNTKACNIAATQDGVGVRTDTDWGGSFFTIEPDKTVEIAILYDNTKPQASVQFMIDSHTGAAVTHGGDVTISEMAFTGGTYTPGDEPENPEPETPLEPAIPEGGTKTQVNIADVTIGGNLAANGGPYTATVENNALNVTYASASDYANVDLSGMGALQSANNVFTAKVTNNGTETVSFRVDVMSSKNVSTNTKACNILATQDGEEVRTDTDWGGSFFTVDAGDTVIIKILYDNSKPQASVQFMIDSHLGTPVAHGGNITISEMAFIDGASSENPEEGDDPVTPPEEEDPVTPPEEDDDPVTPPEEEEPAVTEQKVTINGADIAVDGNLAPDGPYTATVNAEKTELNVTYTNMAGGTWFNVALQGISDIAGAHNAFNAQIKNNGAENVLVRVDICAASGNIINLSATQDGVGVNTDLVNGGSFFTVTPGATVAIQVVYDGSKAPAYALFMLDSFTGGDTNVYNGDVTISAMSFADVTVTPPEEEEPVTPPAGGTTSVDLGEVTLDGNLVANGGPYTATVGENNTLDVTYTAAVGNTYLNVNLSGLESVAAANNVFTFKVTNNGTQTLNLRTDIMSSENVSANTKACNISATQDGVAVRTDTNWGGSFFTVEAGQTVTIQIVYDNTKPQQSIQFMLDTFMGTATTHSGDVTFSEMAFTTVQQ